MWFERLPAPAAAKVSTAFYRIELGNLSSVKNLGGGIFESSGSTNDMTLTRHFKETIQTRLQGDPKFREELLKEGLDSLLSGDVDIAKIVLRDYINATIGFQELGKQIAKSPKSLMRMFSPKGNPSTQNLFATIGCLQKHEGVQFKVQSMSEEDSSEAQVNFQAGL